MERDSYRLFNCARCRLQVRLCSRCDRGQVYCLEGCAAIARRECLRRAGRRYQQTHRGAMHHAARQRAYRLRLARRLEKVTHHGFRALALPARVPAVVDQPAGRSKESADEIHCDCCGRRCDPFARLWRPRW